MEGWDAFWSHSTPYHQQQHPHSNHNNNKNNNNRNITNAHRLTLALEHLGPTYVKFGQALGSRPDVVPKSLAEALSTLQDDMRPFDDEMARQIVWREFVTSPDDGSNSDNDSGSGKKKVTMKELESILSHLNEPVAAASIG